MNISAKTASKHVRNENARIAGVVTHNEREYIIIERLDIQRTDHTEFDLDVCRAIRRLQVLGLVEVKK